MEKINFHDLQAKFNIVDVIQKYITLTKKGNSWVGVCPFHDDTNPSLFVSEKLQVFNCFVCGTKGNAFAFVKQFKNITYNEAVIEVCQSFGIELDKSILANLESNMLANQKFRPYWDACQMMMQSYHDELHRKIKQNDPMIVNFLKQRKLTLNEIDHFKIGFAPSILTFLSERIISGITQEEEKARFKNVLKELGYLNENNHDFFSERIIFPIFDEDGNTVGFSGRSLKNDTTKYLNSKESIIFKKANLLYNLQTIKKNNAEKIYIAEGFMEVISLWKIGIENAVAVMGTSFNTNHVQQLKKITNLTEIIICLDADAPGQEASVNVAQELLVNPNWQISLLTQMPANGQYKDLDELINHESKDLVIHYLQSSVNYFNWYTTYSWKRSKITDSILKKSVVATAVLIEIKKFANFSIINALIDELANNLQLSAKDLKNEFNNLHKVRRKVNLHAQVVDFLTQMIATKFQCKDLNDEMIDKARKCFNIECKLITLFYSNLTIIEFAKKIKCHFVFPNIYKIYQTILNNAINGIVWNLNEFRQFINENDFSHHLVLNCVNQMLETESMYIDLLRNGEFDDQMRMIDELIRQTELANIDLEISSKIFKSYRISGEEKRHFDENIRKLITKKNLLNKTN